MRRRLFPVHCGQPGSIRGQGKPSIRDARVHPRELLLRAEIPDDHRIFFRQAPVDGQGVAIVAEGGETPMVFVRRERGLL